MRAAVRFLLAKKTLTERIRALFARSEQGLWYDPSDFATLFQDSAGTTPVTAVEQPVGLILDKSKGLVLGPELVTNPIYASGAGWTAINATPTYGDGTVIVAASVAYGNIYTEITAAAAGFYEITVPVLAATGGARGAANIYAIDDSTVIGGAGILAAAGQTLHFICYSAADVGRINLRCELSGQSVTFGAVSFRLIPGNHATQATSTKRPILKQDASGRYYLLFDGIDDALATGSIDFTGTDKMTVVAGVRKLSDAATQVIAECNGVSNQFGLYITSVYEYGFYSAGTLSSDARVDSAAYAAPRTNVVSAIGGISTDVSTIRLNGIQAATSAADQGTGNYGNYPLFIGSRAGTSLPFNGHLYSLIVRGAQSSDSQIAAAEAYVAGKTGVTL